MILTHAVSNIARSGATRAGYPVLQGAKVPLYALSNLARSGATRSNYTSTKPFIRIDGIHRGWGRLDGGGVIADSVTKSDGINNTPVTLTFTAYGWVPVEGADVVITLGSKNNLARQFGGTILSTRHRYVRPPVARNMLYDVSCIDYTWSLDNRKVSGNYTGASVAAIAASLMTYAPAGYTLLVDSDIGAERLDQITFTEQTLTGAFAQLAKRVGGDFLCDYLKVVHLFFENTALSPPRIVNAVHPTLQTIEWTRDLSQVATRILGNFGGSNALDQIGPGQTLLPVETAAWYLTAGGRVLVGQQRVTYGGLDAGGGGSLVGPGAAPTGKPNADLLPGAGVDVGSHDYAVTFKTVNGESIPGPRLTVPVGLFLAPSTAPTPGVPTVGNGPDPGVHDYAVAYVISTGETTPGPRVAVSTGILAPPTTSPTPDSVAPGPGPDPGAHDYAVSFFPVGGGETTPGPIGGQITTGGIAAPTTAPNPGSVTAGPGPDPGSHFYLATFVRPEGETEPGPVSTPITTGLVAPPTTAPQAGSTAAGGNVNAGGHAYACTFVRSGGETTPGPIGPTATSGNFGPPAAAPSSAPTCQQYPSQGNYTPGANSGQVGDAVAYALAYATDGTSYTDLSTMGSSSGQQTIQPALAGAPNCCRRTVTIPGPGLGYYRLYVSVNGGSWTCLQFGVNPSTPLTIEVAGQPANFGVYPGPGHGPVANTLNLVNLPTSADATVTARKLYRQSGGAGLRLLTTISDNTTTTYTDAAPNANLGAAPPTINGTLAATVHVSSIQTAPAGAGVIARKLYRYSGSRWAYLTTIPDNTTTSYADTTPNAGLGAAPPTGNTTTGGRQTVHVSSIPTVPGAGDNASRGLYRRSGGVGLRLVAYLYDNTTRTYTDTTPNAGLGVAPSATNTAVLRQIPLTKIPVGNTLVLSRKIYRTPANTGGGTLHLVATIADNTTTTFIDTVDDASLGAAALTVGTAQAAQVQLSAIPIGAAAVIARSIYRTQAGATQLQLLWTIADNTTTTLLDAVSDVTLSTNPNAPTSDNSLLQQPTGNVLAGSPTLPCATVAAFRPTGGWAIVGSQNIRYTGISGNALLGLPPSGPGAINATITWNTTVVAAAMLTGIPATGLGVIKYPILKGDPVNVFVQVDDLDAQAAVRLQLPGSDGVIEDEIQDGRLSYIEGLARCQARLDLLAALDSEGKVGVITVSYESRDINTHAGATVTVYLGPPVNLQGDFLIQRVGVARFNIPHLNPTYTVEASSLRFSAEEMLRLLRQGAF